MRAPLVRWSVVSSAAAVADVVQGASRPPTPCTRLPIRRLSPGTAPPNISAPAWPAILLVPLADVAVHGVDEVVGVGVDVDVDVDVGVAGLV